MGRTKAKISFDGRKTQFNYDLNGRLISLLTPNNKTHAFTYNGHELLEKYLPPTTDQGVSETSYVYNLDKMLTKIIKPNGKELNFLYFPNIKLLNSITTSDSYVEYLYDSNKSTNDNPVAIIRKESGKLDMKLDLTYEGIQTTNESLKELGATSFYHKVSFDYDDRFRLNRVYLTDASNVPSYLVSYSYDRDNLMTRAGELAIERDSQVGFINSLLLNKAKVKYSYDSQYGELSKIDFQFNGKSQFVREFKRDRIGRIVEENDGNEAQSIFYDKSGRLTGRAYKNTNIILSNYIYDKNGNRIRGHEGNKKFTAQFDDQDRLIKYNNATYAYDLDGNVQSKSLPWEVTTYAYDSMGSLRSVSTQSKTVEYDVDPKNRRAVKRVNGNVVTRYVWQDQLRIIAELDSNNLVKSRFVYAEGVNSPEYMVKNGQKFMFIKDHRGSINLVVHSETGEIFQKLRYSDWGEVLEDTNPCIFVRDNFMSRASELAIERSVSLFA